MGDLKNEFAFSFSRFNTLVECPRKFYLSYYAHWNGWNKDASKFSKRVYRLKQLTTMYFWIGNLVHNEIERTIRDLMDDQSIGYDKSLARMAQQSKREFAVSEIRAADPDAPAKMFGLKEHLNGGTVPKHVKDVVWNRGKLCLANFFNMGILERLKRVGRANILSIDDYSKFPVISGDGKEIQVYSVPDLAFRENENVIICDWKTGKAKDNYEDQVALYALYASRYWKVAIPNIEVNICYLLDGTSLQKVATPKWIEVAENKIISQATIMMRNLLDQDHEKNEALHISNFPIAKSDDPCYWCNFVKICGVEEFRKSGRDLVASGEAIVC